ncbi:MAG: serine/threonine-protein kinase [Planctomycetota bacterium]|nr:serine/threonine-protein kinase [Planctomycetota bacterium]
MNEVALPNPGDDVSGYHLVRELGRGGMGVVFVAQRHNEDFALKFILKQTKDDEARFFEEVKAMTLVGQHPHIVAMQDHFSHRNKLCIVCELVVGSDLAAVLAKGKRWIWQDAVELIETLADTLAHIHDEGFLHRDVKPANILIRDYDNHIFLTDFGLAGHSDTGSGSGPKKMIGTALYMSPEQISGERKKIGPQSDIWALGVILFQLLTGERPFHGETENELLGQIMSKNPLETELWKNEWPPELKVLLASVLEKAAENRIQSAAKLGHDCRQLLDHAAKFPEKTMTAGRWKILALTLIFLLPLISIAGARWDRESPNKIDDIKTMNRRVSKEERLLWDRLVKSLYNRQCNPVEALSLSDSDSLRSSLTVIAKHATDRMAPEDTGWQRALSWNSVFNALESDQVLPIPEDFDSDGQRLITLMNLQSNKAVASESNIRKLGSKPALSYVERVLLIIDGVTNEDWSFVDSHFSAKVFGAGWDQEKERWLTEIRCQQLFGKLQDVPNTESLLAEFDQFDRHNNKTKIDRWSSWNKACTERFLLIYAEDLPTAQLLGRIQRLTVAFPKIKTPKLTGIQWIALAKIAGKNNLRPLEAAFYTQATLTGPDTRPPARCHIKEYLLRLGYRRKNSAGIVTELMDLLELGFSFPYHDVEDYLRKADENGTLAKLQLDDPNKPSFLYLSGICPLPKFGSPQSKRNLIEARMKSLDRAFNYSRGLPKGLRGELLFQKIRWRLRQFELTSKTNALDRKDEMKLIGDLKTCERLGFLSSQLEFYCFACSRLTGQEWQRFYKRAVLESKRDGFTQIRDFSFDWKESPSKVVKWNFAQIQVVHFLQRGDLVSAKQVLTQGLQRPGTRRQALCLIAYRTVVMTMATQFVAASRNLSEQSSALSDEEQGQFTAIFEEILGQLENSFSGQVRKDLRGLLEVLKSRD